MDKQGRALKFLTLEADMRRYVDLYEECLEGTEFEESLRLLQEGMFNQAEQMIRALIDKHGGADASAWSVLGLYFLAKKDLDNARRAIDRAMELSTESILTINVAGDFATFSGDFENGEQFYLASLDMVPDQLHPRMILGNRYSVLERYEEAVEILLPLLESHPENEEVWRSLRASVGCLSDTAWMERIAHTLLQQFPEQYYAIWIMGNSFLRNGRFEEALEYCELAVELREDDDLAWTMYGSVLNQLARPKAALECHKRASELNKNDPTTLSTLSLAHVMAGNLNQAFRVAMRVSRLAPEMGVRLMTYLEDLEETEHSGGLIKRGNRRA
jgi:tetratricopeptide (TPR) repeat protein